MKNNPQIMVSKFYGQVAKITLLTSIIWTIVAVTNALQKDYPTEVDAEVIAPLSPTLNEGVIERLTKREQMTEAVDSYIPPSPTPKLSE